MTAATLLPTPILDFEGPEVQALASTLWRDHPTERAYLQAAHRHLSDAMGAIYSIEETQPASRTIRIGKGSCTQRMAVLEALARARGIGTRVLALWLKKRFWFSRLPLLRFFLPKRTLMPWPQFFLEGEWVDFSELYAPIGVLAAQGTRPFTNRGESLFSAVAHCPVDFFSKTRLSHQPRYDLSHFVAGESGFFDSPDALLADLDPKPSAFGRLVFNCLYGGRPIRRVDEGPPAVVAVGSG